MNPYDIIYDLNEEVTKLTRQLEVAKASLNKWESVFGHLGTPDEVGNEWAAMSDRLEAVEKERDTLRAKIKQMENQEPVWFIDERGEPKRYHKSKADYCKYGGLDLLYALPGAKEE